MLFVLYVNELPGLVKSSIKMFADDAKIFRGVNDTTDAQELQEDLNALSNWSKKWLLQFNLSKCKMIHVGHSNSSHDYYMKQSNGIDEKLSTSRLERV